MTEQPYTLIDGGLGAKAHLEQTTSNLPAPDWFCAKSLSPIVGFSRSTLYELAAEGKIRTASFRRKGQKKGRRLFSYSSILKYIEAHATGGLETAV